MARKDREIAELVTPGRLDKPLIVLRKLNVAPLSVRPNRNAPTVMERIGNGYIEQGVVESTTQWFGKGFIVNDQPRDSVLTGLIMANTVGFAVADTRTGEILRQGGPDSLGAMQSMADSAKITFTVDIPDVAPEPVQEESSEESEDAEAVAPAPQTA